MKKSLTHGSLQVCVAAIMFVSVSNLAYAQSGSRNSIPSPTVTGGQTTASQGESSGGTFGTTGFGGSFVSSPIADTLNGNAAILRARSNAVRTASQAAINVQSARGQAIRNRVAMAEGSLRIEEARIASSRLREAYANETRRARAARRAELAASRPRHKKPGLTQSEYNYQTGQISWPSVLKGPSLTRHRIAVDRLAVRKPNGERDNIELKIAAKALRTALGKNARRLGQLRFTAANNFLKRLDRQIRIDTDPMKNVAMPMVAKR